MKIIITDFYKTKKNNVVINFRDNKLGCIVQLISKPINNNINKAVLLNIIKDFRFCTTGKFRHTELKFEIDKSEESCITYFETCYGWDL